MGRRSFRTFLHIATDRSGLNDITKYRYILFNWYCSSFILMDYLWTCMPYVAKAIHILKWRSFLSTFWGQSAFKVKVYFKIHIEFLTHVLQNEKVECAEKYLGRSEWLTKNNIYQFCLSLVNQSKFTIIRPMYFRLFKCKTKVYNPRILLLFNHAYAHTIHEIQER